MIEDDEEERTYIDMLLLSQVPKYRDDIVELDCLDREHVIKTIFRRSSLTQKEKLVLIYLVAEGGKVITSRSIFGKRIGKLSPDALTTTIRELEEMGLVDVIDHAKNHRQPSKYKIIHGNI